MPFLFHPALRCPLDQLPLERHNDALRCSERHNFDIARQGYVNLLGAQDKRSRDPGDSKDMVAARHRFLESGNYQPIAKRLATLLTPFLKRGELVVDAGCGEGYYLQQLHERAQAEGIAEPCLLGFDISKWALQTAARRFPATWMVASNRNIPLADESADVVLDLFGFPDYGAFARVLQPSGLLVRAQSGENHLLELREMIYPQIKERATPPVEPPGFARVNTAHLRYEMAQLSRQSIDDLLRMTPHFFRASPQGKRRVALLDQMTVSVDVSIDILQKTQTR